MVVLLAEKRERDRSDPSAEIGSYSHQYEKERRERETKAYHPTAPEKKRTASVRTGKSKHDYCVACSSAQGGRNRSG